MKPAGGFRRERGAGARHDTVFGIAPTPFGSPLAASGERLEASHEPTLPSGSALVVFRRSAAETARPATARRWPAQPVPFQQQRLGSITIPSINGRDMLRRGVDRPASRQAGLRSLLPRPPGAQHGSAAMPMPPATGDLTSALAP